MLPYLSVDAVSEVLVYVGFAQFFLWLLSPFATRRKSFHAAVVLKRVGGRGGGGCTQQRSACSAAARPMHMSKPCCRLWFAPPGGLVASRSVVPHVPRSLLLLCSRAFAEGLLPALLLRRGACARHGVRSTTCLPACLLPALRVVQVLVILVTCQVLRICTFLSTQLPAPAPHCRAPEPTSNVPWPVVSERQRRALWHGGGAGASQW